MDTEEQKNEIQHIQKALKGCGYPQWTITKVVEPMESSRREKKGKGKMKKETHRKSQMKFCNSLHKECGGGVSAGFQKNTTLVSQ